MDVLVTVWVVDGKRNTYSFRKVLCDEGFKYSSEPHPHWFKDVSEDKLPFVKKWCFKRGLGLVCFDNERSLDYRNCFFESGRSLFLRDKYLCSYCGKVLSKEKVCVDHLVSVKKAQTSRFYCGLIQKVGFESINDVRNLVPSCRRCNSRKGAKGGLWALRGYLGRHPWFWVVFRLVEVICFIWAFFGF